MPQIGVRSRQVCLALEDTPAAQEHLTAALALKRALRAGGGSLALTLQVGGAFDGVVQSTPMGLEIDDSTSVSL